MRTRTESLHRYYHDPAFAGRVAKTHNALMVKHNLDVEPMDLAVYLDTYDQMLAEIEKMLPRPWWERFS